MLAVAEALKKSSEGTQSRFDLWSRFLDSLQVESALEIGVWKGAFATHMLKRCDSIRQYYMIDPWRRLDRWNKPLNTDDGQLEAALKEAMEATRFAEAKRVVLRGTTTEVIARVPDQSLDFIYVDGDHTLRGIAIDLINAYPKLKQGGYLAGDDFTSSIWQHDSRYEPTLVFPFATYFAEAVGMKCYALPFNQFLIHKAAQHAGYEFVDLTGQYKALSLGEQFSLSQLVQMRIKNFLK